LKVGLNATCLNDRPSGAKQRFLGIYKELVKRMPDTEFVVYEPLDCRVGSWFDGAPNVVARHTPIPSEGRSKKLIAGFQYWRSALAHEKFDLFEGFHLPLVVAPTGRTLLLLHDIRGINSEYGLLSRAAFKLVLSRSIRAADLVVTVSESMREEILSIYHGVPIAVIYNGFDAHGFDGITESNMLAFRQKFFLPHEFLLAVGHFEGRKNYLCLINALALLRDRGCPCSLLIIGNDSGERDAIEKRVEYLNLSSHVQILSGLSDTEVRCAYKLCSLFVFPSSYEGFGIPILEAMAAGCPMVLSDIPVFREITQSQGVYFPYADSEALADSIEHVLGSTDESSRMIHYGRQRVDDFNFHTLAAQVESLYKG